MIYIRTIRLFLSEMLGLKKIIIIIVSLIIYILTRDLIYGKDADLLYACIAGPINLYIPDMLSWIYFQITLSSLFGLFLFNHVNIRLAYVFQKINNVKVWLASLMCSILILIFFYYFMTFILAYIVKFIIYDNMIICNVEKIIELLIMNIVTSILLITINLILNIINNNFQFNMVIILIIIFESSILVFTHNRLAYIMPISQLMLLNKGVIELQQALIVGFMFIPINWILITNYIKKNIFKMISREIRR